MRRPKTMIFGIACGILCAASVFAYVQGVKSDADTERAEALARFGGEQLEVCVASRDISPGEKLDTTNTTTKLWVADLLPTDAVRSLDGILGAQIGSVIYEGEVITKKRFVSDEGSFEIPEGLSALSVPVKDVQAIGGAVRPNMRVDVYATDAAGTNLLAEGVLVLCSSISSTEKASAGSVAWVTLAVEPASVQEIISASQKMELYLVLPGSVGKGVQNGA